MEKTQCGKPARSPLSRRHFVDGFGMDELWAGYGRGDFSERLLNRIAIDQALERLRATDRVIIELLYAYRTQPGYAGSWPPTPEEVGEYLGAAFPEFHGRAVSARTVWRRHAAVLETWRKRWEGREREDAVDTGMRRAA